MSESESLESKIVRIQAAVDEMTDKLADELRTAIRIIAGGNTVEGIRYLESMIDAVETFSESGEVESEEEEDETGD